MWMALTFVHVPPPPPRPWWDTSKGRVIPTNALSSSPTSLDGSWLTWTMTSHYRRRASVRKRLYLCRRGISPLWTNPHIYLSMVDLYVSDHLGGWQHRPLFASFWMTLGHCQDTCWMDFTSYHASGWSPWPGNICLEWTPVIVHCLWPIKMSLVA